MTDQDKPGFMESLGGIRKLKQDQIDPYQHRSRQPARLIEQPAVLTKPAAKEIGDTPETTQQSWFHHGLQKKLQKTIKRGQIPIDAVLDLHGYRQKQALQELNALLDYAIKQQARMLLIVHGKGYGSNKDPVLRPLVHHWLSEQTRVLAWCPAQPEHGGSGASYVYLKSSS